MTLRDDDVRDQRFSKNSGQSAGTSRLGTELRPRRPMGGLRQEYHWQVAAAYAVAGTAAVGRRAGTGRVMDVRLRRRHGIEGNSRCGHWRGAEVFRAMGGGD